MSINHYSSDISETPWWSTRQQQSSLMEPSIQNASSCGPPIHPSWPTQTQLYHHHQPPCVMNRGFNLNNQDEELEEEEEEEEEQVENGRFWGSRGGGGEEDENEKEAMFEKALTPSDVGKLNRLVIPKQQAEKYFPLSDSGGENNKGVLLSFEDESCKCWRFRYSYWNSSQSYVLTKGWSRYVKDKRLLAGDVVSFHRLRSLPHRLFISFRRRHTPSAPMPMPIATATNSNTKADNTKAVAVSLGWTTTPFYSAHPYPTHQPFPFPPHVQPLHAPGRDSESEKQITGNSSKVLRLFGVNMECQTEPDDESGSSRPEYPGTHMMSSSTHHHFYHYHHLHPSYAHNPPHRHMDVNQMRNRPG